MVAMVAWRIIAGVAAVALLAAAGFSNIFGLPPARYWFDKPDTYAECVDAGGDVEDNGVRTRCVYRGQSFQGPLVENDNPKVLPPVTDDSDDDKDTLPPVTDDDGGDEPSIGPPPAGLKAQVCLREQYPDDYSHADDSPGAVIGVSAKAFGLGPDVPIEEWRETPLEELIVLFREYVEEFDIADAGRYTLDFEKHFAHTYVENREIIERSVQAVRTVTPDVEISFYGTPFPLRQNGELDRIFEDEDYLEWIQSLGIGYIPVLYIRGDTFPSLEEIEEDARKLLSVFPVEESIPYLWHKWDNGGNWETNPNIIESYPELEPLKTQLKVMEDMGFDRVCFWHAEDDTDIEKTFEVLFGN